MIDAYRYLLVSISILGLLLTWHLTRLSAQTLADKPIPQIIFKDQLYVSIVRTYLRESKAKAVRIQLKPTPTGYQCNLLAAYYYENIANYPTIVWGQWQNYLLVFSGDSTALWRAIRIHQPSNSIGLLTYLQHFLPDDRPPLPKLPKEIIGLQFDRDYDDFGWTFKMERGREVWFSKNGDYDSYMNVPDSLPPVPEAKHKP